jgi:TRAP-type C4-dicarboxylate transport system permease small subunit
MRFASLDPRRLLDGACRGAAWLAACLVLAIFVLMIAQSAFRGLGWSTGGVNDVVGWLTAGAASLAMAHSFRSGDFVRVGLLFERLAPGPRRALELVALTIGAGASGYLALWAAAYVAESWRLHDMPTGQAVVPLWIPQSSLALGAALLLLAVLADLVTVLRGGAPSYERALAERHARGDFSGEL